MKQFVSETSENFLFRSAKNLYIQLKCKIDIRKMLK